MHISVPAYRLISDSSDQDYTVYEIHINGSFHCFARYSSLLKLHELIKRIAPDQLCPFPPKRLKALLNDKALNERREALQDYLRAATQHSRVAGNSLVQRFFLDLQRERWVRASRKLPDHLPVYLLDGSKINVPCFPGDSGNVILERAGRALDIRADHLTYFALFIVTKSDIFPCRVIRWLGNFESPLLSLYYTAKMGVRAKIVLRKCIWSAADTERRLLDDDPGALRVLVAQAKSESSSFVKRNGCLEFGSCSLRYKAIDQDTFDMVRAESDGKDDQITFLTRCQRQPWYGYMFFEQCQCSFPNANTLAHAAVGNKRLIILHPSTTDGSVEEAVFRLTRIRAWRLSIMSTHGCQDLSFEYLFSNNHLEWITIKSAQAVLISLALQSMIEEVAGSNESTVSGCDPLQLALDVKSRAFLNDCFAERPPTTELIGLVAPERHVVDC